MYSSSANKTSAVEDLRNMSIGQVLAVIEYTFGPVCYKVNPFLRSYIARIGKTKTKKIHDELKLYFEIAVWTQNSRAIVSNLGEIFMTNST